MLKSIWDIDLSSIRIETTRDIHALEAQLENLSLTQALRLARTANDTTSETAPEGRRWFLARFFEAILNFISGLTDGLDEVLGNERDDDPNDPENREPTPEEVATRRAEQARRFFEEHATDWIFTGISRPSIAELFPPEWNLPPEAQRLLQLIEDTPPANESIENKMNHLFIENIPEVDGDTSQQVPRLERFLSDMHDVTGTQVLIKNTDNNLHVNGLLTAVNYYRSYRERNEQWKELPENANTNRNMTFREYFEEISSGDDSE